MTHRKQQKLKKMVIKLLQQSTFRLYAAKVLPPFLYFCCFPGVIMPLTGVINYVFFIYFFRLIARCISALTYTLTNLCQ